LETLRSGEDGYQFLRPVIIDYVNGRLAEAACVSTVRLEMAAIRGLFDFMLAMGAFDVLINPARNVKVTAPKQTSNNIHPDHSRLSFFGA
jgi:hypothetical protein